MTPSKEAAEKYAKEQFDSDNSWGQGIALRGHLAGQTVGYRAGLLAARDEAARIWEQDAGDANDVTHSLSALTLLAEKGSRDE
jgi:hypothetical protein